jgi:hypothetical protein
MIKTDCAYKKNGFSSVLLVVYFIFISVLSCMAQSTSQSAMQIQNDADSSISGFINLISNAREDASLVVDGKLEQQAQMVDSKLIELEQRIDSQVDFITKKEIGLSPNLSEADRMELKTTLASQKKPLVELKSKLVSFRKALSDLSKNLIPQWRDLYKSFLDIAGETKASEKMSSKITEYLKSMPAAWRPPEMNASLKSNPSRSVPVAVSVKAMPTPTATPDTSAEKMSFSNLKKSASQGNTSAQKELARRYRYGFDAPRDTGEAVKWYTLAAQNGDLESQLALGMMYKNGEGVAMNLAEARKWLAKAAANGSQFAKSTLHQLK